MTRDEAAAPLRLGVLGCADIAYRRTLPAMEGNPDVQVVAIASRDARKAARFTDRFGGDPLHGYELLLERDDVDAVYVPLPARMHAAWIERALTAGKHVLAEKPMTDSYHATNRLLALARSRDLVLLENFMFLHHSQHTAVHKLVADGAIGEIRQFSSAFTIPPKAAGDIRYQPEVGGGAFLDFGGYPVRAALLFLGGDLEVVGAVFRHESRRDVVLSGTVLLATASGVPVSLSFGMEHSYRNSYSLFGSTGRLELDWVFTPPESHRPVLRIERQDHREELVLPADHQFANVTAAFVRAVRTGADRRAHETGTLEQARLMERIERQARYVNV